MLECCKKKIGIGEKMIALIGIKKNVSIEVREALAIEDKNILQRLLESFREVVLLTTCNRTEIYINTDLPKEESLNIIFKELQWSEILKKHIFYIEEDRAYNHLFKLCCGFHSKIVGEDQILGQVKNSYSKSLVVHGAKGVLGRLFQETIACGKDFRKKTKLFEIPVSSSSITSSILIKHKCKKVMIIGYGEVGKLVLKYLDGHSLDKIYLAVRNVSKIVEDIPQNVEVIDVKDKNKYLSLIDGIVSCTNSKEILLYKKDLEKVNKDIIIIDLAFPRDVEEGVGALNIDHISFLDDENKELRKKRMYDNKFIIEEHLEKFNIWNKTRVLSPLISEIKKNGNTVVNERFTTFHNKCCAIEDEELSKRLIKSTSDYYINRAIELLKEEALKGSDEECQRIIKKIFL